MHSALLWDCLGAVSNMQKVASDNPPKLHFDLGIVFLDSNCRPVMNREHCVFNYYNQVIYEPLTHPSRCHPIRNPLVTF